MAYRRPFRRSPYGRRRSYGTWRRGSSAYRRTWGNMRAARRQTDAASTVINRVRNVTLSLPVPSEADKDKDTSWCGVVLHHWNELASSAFYANYAGMYDQMKLNSVKLRITGATNNLGAAVLANPYSCPQVVLALDRNGLDSPSVYTATHADPEIRLTTPASAQVSTYSSSRLYAWSSGNSFRAFQTVFPSSIQEKGMYVSTSDVQAFAVPDGEEPQQVDLPALANPVATACYPWKPQTLLAVRSPVANTDGPTTFTFTVEMSFAVTFRGLRKSPLQYSSNPDPDDAKQLKLAVASNGHYAYADGPYSDVDLTVSVPSEVEPKVLNVRVSDPDFSRVYNTGPYTEVRVYADLPENEAASLSKVLVSNGRFTYSDGPYQPVDITVNVPAASAEKTLEAPITENGTFTYSDGPYKDAKISVDVPPYADKNLAPTLSTNGEHVFTDGPYRRADITVDVPPWAEHGLNVDIEKNGTYTYENGPYGAGTVRVDVPPWADHNLDATISNNGTIRYTDGPYRRVNLDVDVAPVLNIVKVSARGSTYSLSNFDYAARGTVLRVSYDDLLVFIRQQLTDAFYTVSCLCSSSRDDVEYTAPNDGIYTIFATGVSSDNSPAVVLVDDRGRNVVRFTDTRSDKATSDIRLYQDTFYIDASLLP